MLYPGEGERDRSPEVDRSRRERSTSRDRYPERREDNRRGKLLFKKKHIPD